MKVRCLGFCSKAPPAQRKSFFCWVAFDLRAPLEKRKSFYVLPANTYLGALPFFAWPRFRRQDILHPGNHRNCRLNRLDAKRTTNHLVHSDIEKRGSKK